MDPSASVVSYEHTHSHLSVLISSLSAPKLHPVSIHITKIFDEDNKYTAALPSNDCQM